MNDDQKINYFAEANFRNQKKKFGIKKIDRRKHMYIIGKTGMGKTTLLENLAMQDIVNGEGLAFIDPHGDTASKLLDFVPEERIKDVIYFDPADTDFPIGFNVMETVDPERRHFVASGLMSVFKKIFGPDVWSARMEYILNNTVLALLEYPGSTILNINAMLAVKEFRKKVVDSITDPIVKAFWTQEFAKYTERFAAEATPAIQNKVGQFTSNSLIRNIVGQPVSAFDARKIMDEKKILIINLAKGRVGEDNMRLIGTMLVTKIYLAAMSRVDVADESKRPDFFLYVDEFQNFATESFANILAEARKYRLSLIMANQYMAQLDETVRDAVIGNIGTMVSFRVGAEDAEFLEKEFAPEFEVQDMVSLGFASIYLKLMIDGIGSRPFSATTLGPIKVEGSSLRDKIIESSRANYGSPRKNVEDQILKWQESMGTDSAGVAPAFDRRPSMVPQSDMHEALCAVCGKKVMVPFVPDPSRPIFCKDHLGMAGQFRKSPPQNEIQPRPQFIPPRQSFSPPPVSSPPPLPPPSKKEEGFISLKNLKRPAPAFPQKSKTNDSLQALREALKKSLVKDEPVSTKFPELKQEKELRSDSSAKILKPGDKIEL